MFAMCPLETYCAACAKQGFHTLTDPSILQIEKKRKNYLPFFPRPLVIRALPSSLAVVAPSFLFLGALIGPPLKEAPGMCRGKKISQVRIHCSKREIGFEILFFSLQALIPKLKAKPIRTASGVSII